MRTPRSGVVFLLDGSLSMSATDAEPNRFAHATTLISRIVSRLSAAQSSLVVFS